MMKPRNWWELPGVGAVADELFPSEHGSHATPTEISITQSAYPGSIKQTAFNPQVARTGPVRDALDFRGRFADGRVGSDSLQATPEKSARLIATAVEARLREVTEHMKEPFVVRKS